MSVTTIARGDTSRVTEPRRILARTDGEWRALWAIHAGPEAAAPPVDLSRVVVAAAFAGEKPSAGYCIEISAADHADHAVSPTADHAVSAATDRGRRDRGIRLAVITRAPARDEAAAAILTSPFHFVAVDRAAGDVTWVDEGGSRIEDRGSRIEDRGSRIEDRGSRIEAPGPRASTLGPRSSVPGTRSSTGLDPRTAATLAYLAGPFSGALILLAESTNDDVRFHAWQSIVGLGGLGLAIIASYILAVVALFVSATMVSLMVGVAYVIWIVLAIVWALCLWKAWSGGRWKLPLAGDYAERLL